METGELLVENPAKMYENICCLIFPNLTQRDLQ